MMAACFDENIEAVPADLFDCLVIAEGGEGAPTPA
jgi:hypothetical protein